MITFRKVTRGLTAVMPGWPIVIWGVCLSMKCPLCPVRVIYGRYGGPSAVAASGPNCRLPH